MVRHNQLTKKKEYLALPAVAVGRVFCRPMQLFVLGGILAATIQAQDSSGGSSTQGNSSEPPAGSDTATVPNPADPISNPEIEVPESDGNTPTPDDLQRRGRRFAFSEDDMASSLFQYGSFGFHPGVGYSVSYNDNIFGGRGVGLVPVRGATANNLPQVKSKDDILHRFMVDFAGSFFTGDPNDITVPIISYRPEYLIYTENSDRNAMNHNGALRVLKQFPRTAIALDHTSSSRQDTFAETATNERQTSHTTGLSIHYVLGGKTTLESETSQRFLKSSSFLETKEWREDLWLNYELRPKLGVAIGTSGGYSMVSEGGNSWVHADQIRFTYYPTEKLTFNVRGGYEWRFAADDEGRDQTGFIAGMGADYQVAEFTDLSLSAERSMRPSIYLVNETAIYNTVALTLRQEFLTRFFASVAGSYSHVEYDEDSGSGGTPLEPYDFYTSQFEVGYSITKRATSSVYYRRLGRSSSAGTGDFTSNEVGLNLEYHF